MKNRAKLHVLFAVVVLMLLIFTACGKSSDEAAEDNVETAETVDEMNTDWDGVYEGTEGVAVIRDANKEELHFSVSLDELSLSGSAAVDGSSAEYSDSDCGIVFAVSDDKLLLEYAPSGTDDPDGFFVILTRNDEDPYTYVIMREDEAIPADEPRFDMTATTEYKDPAGKFKVTMPDIFDKTPDEAQPEDGIYMQTEDGSVYIMVETMKKVASDEKGLVDYLAGLGVLAAIRPDGMVVYSQHFTDGTNDPWAEFVFMRIVSDAIVKVDYVCAEEYYDECAEGCSLISIE